MDISFLDSTFTQICDPIDDFSSLSYTKTGCRWEEHGEFKLVMNPDYYATVSPAKYVAFDGLVFNVTNRKTKDEDADGQMSLSGYSLSVLFDRVVITDNVRVRGNLEVQARALVATYAMTGFQTISGLALGTLAGFTRGIDATAKRGTRLADFLFTELNKRGYSWRISYTGGSLVFDVLRGLDRTQTQDANTPALFSSEEENVENVEYEQSETEYYNVAIVCDEDETAPKTVIVDQSNGEEKRVLYVKGTTRGAADGTNKYVISGSLSGNPYVATSTNGTTFSAVTLPGGTSGSATRVICKDGIFFALGSGAYWYSLDNAVTWTKVSTPLYRLINAEYNDGFISIFGRDITYPTTCVFLVGYDIDSLDVVSLESGDDGYFAPLFFKDAYVALCQQGSELTTYTAPKMLISYDALSYENVSISVSPTTYVLFAGIATDGNTIMCAGSRRSGISTGTQYACIVDIDPIDRTGVVALTANAADSIVSITYGNGYFVAVSAAGLYYKSIDKRTWTSGTVPGFSASSTIRRIIFDGQYFRIYSYEGSALHSISSDGESWTTTTLSVGSAVISSAAFGTSAETGNLYQDGVDALESSRVVELLDCDTLPDSTPAIGTDCNLGDIVDIAHPKRGIIVSKRLIDVQAIVDLHNHTVKPIFGTNYLSMKKFIKKEIKNRV